MTRVLSYACAMLLPVATFAQTATPDTAPVTGAAHPPAMAAPEIGTISPNLTSPSIATEEPAAVPAPALTNGAETSVVAPENTVEAPSEDAEVAFDEISDVEITPLSPQQELTEVLQTAASDAHGFLKDGGPSIWAIATLSVITLALILWKIWQLALMGAWSRGKAGKAVAAFERGDVETALETVARRRGVRSKVILATLQGMARWNEERAREDASRVAKNQLAEARAGLSALELIATIAPLLGLLGTVLGMIAAFQALQTAGSNADPSQLAGGIWEALLTTAAGMAVAIPASAALTWFESVIDRIHRDIEDAVTRLFVAYESEGALQMAAE